MCSSSLRAFSSSLLCPIIARNHLPLLKILLNFLQFSTIAQIFKYFALFCGFLTFFLPLLCLFSKKLHACTYLGPLSVALWVAGYLQTFLLLNLFIAVQLGRQLPFLSYFTLFLYRCYRDVKVHWFKCAWLSYLYRTFTWWGMPRSSDLNVAGFFLSVQDLIP